MIDLTHYLQSTITKNAIEELNFSSQNTQQLINGFEFFKLQKAISTAIDESDSILCFRADNILNELINVVKSTSQSSANCTTIEIIRDIHEKFIRVLKLFESMATQSNHESSSSTSANSSQTLLSSAINLSCIEANEG
jgi:hypothetical protein